MSSEIVKVQVLARAKINLFLSVIAKRDDGYHDIESIFQALELADEVTIKPAASFSLQCSDRSLEGLNNIAAKAAFVFCENSGIEPNFEISIVKNIPVQAGLAGGSADAAAVLRGLMVITGITKTTDELRELALMIGSDVVYCALGSGISEVGGKGDKLTALPDLPKTGVLLIKPAFGISTQKLYENIDRDIDQPVLQPNSNLSGLKSSIIAKDPWKDISYFFYNIFEKEAESYHSELKLMLEKIRQIGLTGCGMSGTGPTLFILGDVSELMRAKEALADDPLFDGCSFFETSTATETLKFEIFSGRP